MSKYLPASELFQKGHQAACVVKVTMRYDDFTDLREIFPHPGGIMKQCETLAGVKENRLFPLPFNQGCKAVFTQGSGNRPHTVIAKHRNSYTHFPQQLLGNLGTPSLPSRLNIGQNWVNPD